MNDIELMDELVKRAEDFQKQKEKEAFQKGVAKGYRMALEDLGIIKKEGENDVN